RGRLHGVRHLHPHRRAARRLRGRRRRRVVRARSRLPAGAPGHGRKERGTDMSITIMRLELVRESGALLEAVMGLAARPESTELERARKLKLLAPLLERVVLYASGVREVLEGEQRQADDELAMRTLLTEGAAELLALEGEHPDVPALAALCQCGRDR